ncbi:MAG: hypothetical protein ABSG90_05590 [Dehalococcoidia bacterium]|jgi:nucleoside 2-deoxyribosyltransferase
MTDQFITLQLGQIHDKTYLLSALTRQASDNGNPLRISTENFNSLLDSIPHPMSPLESMNLALSMLMKKHTRADKLIKPNVKTDYPLVFAHDANEFGYFLDILRDQDLLEISDADGQRGLVRLTPKGWERALALQKAQPNSDQAFVAMSFAPECDDAWEKGFKPALKAAGFYPYRVDKEEHNEKIDDKIIAEIQRSGLLVADFTQHRQGVYFEAGFAKGLGIPVIWTCKESDIELAHFDTRQYNHILWGNPDELQSKLKLRVNVAFPGRKAIQ